jgi:DNA ligase (NAD+)
MELTFIEDKPKETTQGVFSGKSLYATGTFANYKKNELKELIESNGGTFASGYAKSLSYLVVGSIKGSSKEDKAKKDGIEILTEDQFIQLIKGN